MNPIVPLRPGPVAVADCASSAAPTTNAKATPRRTIASAVCAPRPAPSRAAQFPGGSRPPDPLAGLATVLAAGSPLGFGSGRDTGRGLAPPGPRLSGGQKKTLAPLARKGGLPSPL